MKTSIIIVAIPNLPCISKLNFLRSHMKTDINMNVTLSTKNKKAAHTIGNSPLKKTPLNP